jgi:nuclear GTP-binding protein
MSTKRIAKAKKSKRTTTHARVNTEKRVKEAKRRIKKEYKKMKKEGVAPKKRPSKELKVPNMHPWKKSMLEQLKRSRHGQKAAKALEEQDVGQNRVVMLENAVVQRQGDGIQAVMETEETEQPVDLPSNPQGKRIKNNMKPIQHIFENADVLLEVLDARDPMGCRCRNLEQNLLRNYPGKRLILVINKIDLVPIEIVNRWQAVLSREYPTIIFKANLQHQGTHLSGQSIHKKLFAEQQERVQEIVQGAKAVGTDKLFELIKNYSRVEDGPVGKITVGVFGYPNVGKSSVINSLTRRKSAPVSSRPGHTKALQEIEIDSKVTLIDSPGIVMSDEDEITLLLRNTIKPEDVVDLTRGIEEILKRGQKEELLKLYKIADYSNSTEFLVNIALRTGKLKKGGIPNLEEAARIVIRDWNEGKIKYYVPPPTLVTNMQSVVATTRMETE